MLSSTRSRGRWLPFALLLLLLGLFTTYASSETISYDASSTASYAGRPVVTPYPYPPLLAYNAAKLPSIVQNVGTKLDFDNNGNLVHDPAVYHYDTSQSRKDQRRNAAGCNERFYENHPCPERDQPPVVKQGGFVDLDLNPQGLAFDGQTYQHSGSPVKGALKNLIADNNGQYQGMFWSCDEWPPATFVEGGADANTICAPQHHSCAKHVRTDPQYKGKGQKSEQNWQAAGHASLRVSPTPVKLDHSPM